MNQIVAQLTQFFLQYSVKQRIIIAGIIVGFLSTVIALMMWANKTEYELLYANLSPQDASEIVTALSNDKVKYRLENSGTTIYVQQDMVNELRVRFHSNGMGNDAPQGWDDIFDPEKTNIGETTTMQRIKILRAKEGELMKTLNLMRWIKSSRVHLNIPERRLFEDDRRGSASVVLTLSGSSVSEQQLKSIPALIAHSVEGMQPEDVTVVDSQGNLLYNGEDDSNLGQSGTQWELTKTVSKELKSKVRSLIETAVGYANSSVQVDVELNFDQVQQTIEDIDPDDVTVVSEQIVNENSQNGKDSSGAAVENSTTNYEFSKTVKSIIQSTGNIKRLSVAVLINGKYDVSVNEDGENVSTYVPRTRQELDDLATLVKGAVGFNEERGDKVDVINAQFASQPVYEPGIFDEFKSPDLWKDIITYILIAIGLFLGFTLLKGLMNSEATSKILMPVELQKKALAGKTNIAGEFGLSVPKAAPEEEEEIHEDIYIAKLSPEARARMKANDKMTRDVIKFAKDKPEQATGLMRAWLAESQTFNER